MNADVQRHSAGPEALPGFFILGGPKCGTTTVFDWLRQHPDTYLPAKEPNFLSPDVFDASDLPTACRDREEYLRRLCPPSAAGKLTGEATPRYLYSDRALDILARSDPSVRFLVLLRNPVDLVFSLHAQMVKQGDETEFDFEKAWRRSLEWQGDPSAWIRHGRTDRRLDYPLYGRFGSRLDKVLEMVGRERVKIMVLEETLSREPMAAFREIADFLGLDPIDPPALSRSNEHYAMRWPGLRSTLLRGRRTVLGLLAAAGLRPAGGTGILKAFERLNRVDGASRPSLGPAMRAELAEFFRDEVALTERLLGREIVAWADFRALPPAGSEAQARGRPQERTS